MIKDFAGKRVAITGGATGIGLALGKRMAGAGAHLMICGLDADALETARLELLSAGAASARADVVDVTDGEAFTAWVNALGDIDMGWNNAGIMQPSVSLHAIDWADYHAVMAVNLHAVMRGSQLFARRMIAQGTPALILNTGSENSLFHGVPGGGPYVASKQAVRALTESLYQDTPDHIDVKLLCPGFVNTPLGPEAQFQHGMDIDVFADAAFALLTSDQFYLVTHGFNAVRVREREAKVLADIEAGALSAEQTRAFDTYTLMQRSSFWD